MIPIWGYLLGKLIVFTIIPLLFILIMERNTVKNILITLGVHLKNLPRSILYGLIALIITVSIVLFSTWGSPGIPIGFSHIMLFFEAFNEEFLFRGILLLYLWKLTNGKIALTTSTLASILAHSQYYIPFYTANLIWLLNTIIQGVLLGVVTYKTRNIIGPWISHGLNRVIPQALRIILFSL